MSLRSLSRFLAVLLLVWAVVPVRAQDSTDNKTVDTSNSVSVSTAPSAAPTQAKSSGYAGETKPAKFEVFLGYSWMTLQDTLSGFKNGIPVTTRLKDAKGGFLIDFSYFFTKYAGVTIDTGAHFGDNYDADEIFVGPTLRFPGEHIQPFAHFLGGWSRLSPGILDSNDAFGFAVGGGLDVKLSRHVNLRLIEADYRYGAHGFGGENPGNVTGARLAAGFTFLAGVGEQAPVSATCSASPTEVFAGEPVKLSVTTQNFNPKHSLNYEWATNGGKIQGQGDNVTVDTTGLADGQSYVASVHVTDPKDKKLTANCQANYATKKRLPPIITCNVNPNSLLAKDGPVTIHCDASSPQGGPVTVSHQGSNNISGQGTDLTVTTTGFQPGTVTVQSTVTDDHQLTANTSTSFTIQTPPPPPVVKRPPTLELRSVYFATAQPTPKNPNGGLVASQQKTLTEIANEFKNYLAVKPDAKLTLEAHADPRGSDKYNEALTERRAARVKSFLAEHGVPAESLDTKSYGKQEQLTAAQVKESIDNDPDLTPGERKRIVKNMRTIVLASNRRVDITLNATGEQQQQSARKYPFSAEDSLSLIGGREKPAPPTTTKPRPPRKRTGAATKGATKKGATKKGAGKKKGQ